MSDHGELFESLSAATRGGGAMTEHRSPPAAPVRHRLPETRDAQTTKLCITSCSDAGEVEHRDVYITVGFYPNGQIGEVFVSLGGIGSAERALLDAWCVMVSIALQCGCPIEWVVRKFRGYRFEPSGMTDDPGLHVVASSLDLVVQHLMIVEERRNPQLGPTETPVVAGNTKPGVLEPSG